MSINIITVWLKYIPDLCLKFYILLTLVLKPRVPNKLLLFILAGEKYIFYLSRLLDTIGQSVRLPLLWSRLILTVMASISCPLRLWLTSNTSYEHYFHKKNYFMYKVLLLPVTNPGKLTQFYLFEIDWSKERCSNANLSVTCILVVGENSNIDRHTIHISSK